MLLHSSVSLVAPIRTVYSHYNCVASVSASMAENCWWNIWCTKSATHFTCSSQITIIRHFFSFLCPSLPFALFAQLPKSLSDKASRQLPFKVRFLLLDHCQQERKKNAKIKASKKKIKKGKGCTLSGMPLYSHGLMLTPIPAFYLLCLPLFINIAQSWIACHYQYLAINWPFVQLWNGFVH